MKNRASTADSANLDFLRAFAVLTVYLGHLLQTFGVEHVFGWLTIHDFAQTGVLIFFVHTALVLMLSMDRMKCQNGFLSFASAFYIRRAFRIYPLSIATISLMLAFRIPSFPTLPFHFLGGRELAENLLLLQNIRGTESYPVVLWSLPFEIQMYIALPVLYVILRRFSEPAFTFILWGVSAGLVSLSMALHLAELSWLLGFVPCFMAGIIAYRLWPLRLNLPFAFWPVLIVLCVLARSIAASLNSPSLLTIAGWVICLVIGSYAPQFRELRAGRIRKVVGWIAKYSYGIYLCHCATFWLAFEIGSEARWARSLICVGLSIVLPVALYHAIERPMINLGIRLSRPITSIDRRSLMADATAT